VGGRNGERLWPLPIVLDAEPFERGDPVDAVLAVQIEHDDTAGPAADPDVAAGRPRLAGVCAGPDLPAWRGFALAGRDGKDGQAAGQRRSRAAGHGAHQAYSYSSQEHC
jgi:hypothetical protein